MAYQFAILDFGFENICYRFALAQLQISARKALLSKAFPIQNRKSKIQSW
ncbi:MAG: hypothetical protein F6K42_18315 [Leptolyngbya sp. SIO1D8]|nr:hypothetical protein [Leptolyngbya sp. SIO1D8]